MKKLLPKAAGFALALFVAGACYAEAPEKPWYVQGGAGWFGIEKDQSYLGQQDYQLRAGWRFDTRWSIEAGVGVLPLVRKRNYDQPTPHYQMTGDTSGVALFGDLLYHVNEPAAEQRWDPFVAVGGGAHLYGKNIQTDSRNAWIVDIGMGTFYYFGDDLDWYLRPDYRLMITGDEGALNQLGLISVGYRWGGAKEVKTLAEENRAAPVLATVYFAFDSAKLSPTAEETLKKNAEWLNANPNERIVIEGHCDERGTIQYNLALGQRRADSVFNYLRTLGVSPDRLRTISYGEEYPADPGHNEAAWAKNRRAEFKFDGQRAVPAQ